MLLQSLLRPVLTPLMRGMFDAPIFSSSAWSPLALWPDGISSAGMWISPRDLTSQWADYTGTTPVATPGTVADSSNPVGLALDIRAGTPVLGPELVTNGDFSAGMAGWTLAGYTTAGTPSGGSVRLSGIAPNINFNPIAYQTLTTVVGRTYKISFPCTFVAGNVNIACYASGIGIGHIANLPSSEGIHIQATSTTTTLAIYAWNGASTDVPFDATVGPATVKEVPGLHMLQSTSAARPLLSARVNLLTYTELPGGLTDWATRGGAVTAATLTGWRNGITTGAAFAPNAGFAYLFCDASIYAVTAGVQYVFSCDVRMDDGGAPVFSTTRVLNDFDIIIADDAVPTANRSITHLGDGIYRVSGQMVAGAGTAGNNGIFVDSVSNASGRGFKVTAFQLERNTTALPYQQVNTASDYDSTGFPTYQKYDGVDDSMATAAFSAGTLTSGMDCMIPVRRDSAASCVAGLYNGIADATKFFGMAESASGSGCVGSGAGTPTVWVDNTQLTGGTAVTRGTLHTALTVGDWHILEFRNLDLSTWTASGFGLYTSYVFPGPRGDILLFPSTASTEDKDAARQWLADYYGVTLS